jgi:pimeloyl-ACP methyl ester carboxylesterase
MAVRTLRRAPVAGPPAAGDARAARLAPDPEPWSVWGPADAPAIVFIHGTRLSRRQWNPQVRRLADRFRCVTVDLPEHGTRAAEPFTIDAACAAVEAAIDAAVPSGRAVLVGLSLGGYVAIDTAEHAPDKVAGLVLAGCSADPVGPSAAGIRLLAWILERVPAGGLGFLNRWFFRVRYGRTTAEPLIEGGFWLQGGARALRLLVGRRYLERLGRLWTPVLVINGALDPVFGPGGDTWAATCRRGRNAVLPRAMHLSNLDRPGPFSELVARFVTELDQDDRTA